MMVGQKEKTRKKKTEKWKKALVLMKGFWESFHGEKGVVFSAVGVQTVGWSVTRGIYGDSTLCIRTQADDKNPP